MCFVLVDYWKVIIISGSYTGEPRPPLSDQLQAAANTTHDEVDAGNKPDAEAVGPEKDQSSKQEDAIKQDDFQQLNQGRDGTENTNNNADSDSEDDQFTKKQRKGSKYLVIPRPPASQLVLVVYGDLGKTGFLPLTPENPQDVSFEAGKTDEFKVYFHVACNLLRFQR